MRAGPAPLTLHGRLEPARSQAKGGGVEGRVPGPHSPAWNRASDRASSTLRVPAGPPDGGLDPLPPHAQAPANPELRGGRARG